MAFWNVSVVKKKKKCGGGEFNVVNKDAAVILNPAVMSRDAKSVSSPPDAALFCQKNDGRILTVLFKVPVCCFCCCCCSSVNKKNSIFHVCEIVRTPPHPQKNPKTKTNSISFNYMLPENYDFLICGGQKMLYKSESLFKMEQENVLFVCLLKVIKFNYFSFCFLFDVDSIWEMKNKMPTTFACGGKLKFCLLGWENT